MSGPCMCGDTYCHSCGPAQGNTHCPYCGKWEFDGGCEDPEACARADAQYWHAVLDEETDEDEPWRG